MTTKVGLALLEPGQKCSILCHIVVQACWVRLRVNRPVVLVGWEAACVSCVGLCVGFLVRLIVDWCDWLDWLCWLKG